MAAGPTEPAMRPRLSRRSPLPSRNQPGFIYPPDRAPRAEAAVDTGRTASVPGGTGQGKDLGSRALTLSTTGLGLSPEALTFKHQVGQGRRQSSRPPPLPPAIPESWQRRGQRREGERRRPPCELQPVDSAAPTAPASEQGPSCQGFLSRGSGPFPSRILLGWTLRPAMLAPEK